MKHIQKKDMQIPKDIIYKTFNFECKEAFESETNEGVGVVRGYAATFGNIDRGYDRIMPGAFDKTIADHKRRKRRVRMLWQHRSTDLIGGYPPELIEIDQDGVVVEGLINLEVQRGKEAYALAKSGDLSDFSIGFRIVRFEFVEEDGVMIRLIHELELFEVSLVGEPMNQNAIFTDVKNLFGADLFPIADKDHDFDAEKADQNFKEFIVDQFGSEHEELKSYSHLVKSDDEYKFPFVDVIDSKLHVVPSALKQAVVDLFISDVDQDLKDAAIERAAPYFEKMGVPSPFNKKTFRIDDFEGISERKLEKLFKTGVCFNSKTAKTIISAMKSQGRDAPKDDDQREAGNSELLAELNKTLLVMKGA